jgi:costal 2 protein
MVITRPGDDESNLVGPRPAAEDPGEEVFALQFAASQYKALVSNAESLLQTISSEARPGEQRQIESWLCRKEESEDVIKKSGEGEKNPLAKILEEEEEGTEGSSTARSKSSAETSQETTDVGESIEDFDSECSDVSAEDIEARLEVIAAKFRADTEALVNDWEVQLWTAGMDVGGQLKVPERPSSTVLKEPLQKQVGEVEQQLKRSGEPTSDLQSAAHALALPEVQSSEREQEGRRAAGLEEQLALVQGEHRRVGARLAEEQERRRGLEAAVERGQGAVLRLEARLRQQEDRLRDSLGASQSLEERAEAVRRAEARVGELGAAAERRSAGLQEREHSLAAREIGEQETSFVEGLELAPLGPNMASVRTEVHDLRTIRWGLLQIEVNSSLLVRPRDQLVIERQQLDDLLHEQKSLSAKEERRMIELDESVEAIDGAIEYKNDMLCGKHVVYDSSHRGEDVLMQRLVRLGLPETRAMLHRWQGAGRAVKPPLQVLRAGAGPAGGGPQDGGTPGGGGGAVHAPRSVLWVTDCLARVSTVTMQGSTPESWAAGCSAPSWRARGSWWPSRGTTRSAQPALPSLRPLPQVKINLLAQQLAEQGTGGNKGQDQARSIKTLEKEVTFLIKRPGDSVIEF